MGYFANRRERKERKADLDAYQQTSESVSGMIRRGEFTPETVERARRAREMAELLRDPARIEASDELLHVVRPRRYKIVIDTLNASPDMEDKNLRYRLLSEASVLARELGRPKAVIDDIDVKIKRAWEEIAKSAAELADAIANGTVTFKLRPLLRFRGFYGARTPEEQFQYVVLEAQQSIKKGDFDSAVGLLKSAEYYAWQYNNQVGAAATKKLHTELSRGLAMLTDSTSERPAGGISRDSFSTKPIREPRKWEGHGAGVEFGFNADGARIGRGIDYTYGPSGNIMERNFQRMQREAEERQSGQY